MTDLLKRLKKNSKISDSGSLKKSVFYSGKDMTPTTVPMMNVALSGDINGGLTSGVTMISGKSRHFKSNFTLLIASAYMKKYPEAVMIFYDSEFGSPQGYFKSFGIDLDRVLHTPIMNIEEMKFDLANQLENITRDDKVIIVVDSIGNLASKKEVDDAINENSAADMTRAKQLKSMFRIATPYLTKFDIPMICINHTYAGMSQYTPDVVSGGSGAIYASDTIIIVGRQQERDGKDIAGYHFVLNIEKSRFVKEKSKIPITVMFEGGIMTHSGILDVAVELGYVVKPKNGWYRPVDPNGEKVEEDGKMVFPSLIGKNVRAKDTLTKEFWETSFAKTDLAEAIKRKFQLESQTSLIKDEIAKNAELDAKLEEMGNEED